MKLPLPQGVFEQHIIALGKTGAGKSSALRDLVESLLEQEKRVVIATPKSDWWGLKLAADGKHAGYPVVVFGGDHADMPLHHLSGKTMAELLGTGNRSAVLQMREWMPAERTQFWIDFASNLFRLLKGKCERLALADGFAGFSEMMEFWKNPQRLPFTGRIYHWA